MVSVPPWAVLALAASRAVLGGGPRNVSLWPVSAALLPAVLSLLLLFVAVCGSLGLGSENRVGGGC